MSAPLPGNVRIREETRDDHSSIRDVLLLAFPTAAEANLVEDLRGGGWVQLSLVAEIGDQIVGHALFHRLTWRRGNEELPVVSLAPLAVQSEFQRRGIGAALVAAGLDECRVRGATAAFVLGDPRYYGRFGFSTSLAAPLACAYAGEYFQAVELQCGALADARGEIIYPPPFDAL